jgi:putative transcriptional regulator
MQAIEPMQVSPGYGGPMIDNRLDELLERCGKSLYAVQKETGLAYSTLWKLRSGRANSITFDVLDKLCTSLDCQPGDLLIQVKDKTKRKS